MLVWKNVLFIYLAAPALGGHTGVLIAARELLVATSGTWVPDQ